MNSLILFPDEMISEHRAVLRGKRAEYVISSHSVEAGKPLRAALLGGDCGTARVTASSRGQIELELALDQEPPGLLPFTAIVAITRPQTVKKIVQTASMLGIKELHFVRCARGVKSYLQSQVLQPESIIGEIVKGLEQSMGSLPPAVVVHQRFKPFAQDVLPGLLLQERESVRLLADTTKGVSCSAPLPLPALDAQRPAFAAFGPEAGWNEFEISTFVELGFGAISLGQRVLRVETAFTALLGHLIMLRQSAKSEL